MDTLITEKQICLMSESVYELSTNIIVYSDAGRKVLKRFEFVGKDAHDLGDGYPSRSHSY